MIWLPSFLGLFFILRLLVLSGNPCFQHINSRFSPAEIVSVQKHNIWADFLNTSSVSVLLGGLRTWPLLFGPGVTKVSKLPVQPAGSKYQCCENSECSFTHPQTHTQPHCSAAVSICTWAVLFTDALMPKAVFAAIRKAFIHLVTVSDFH